MCLSDENKLNAITHSYTLNIFLLEYNTMRVKLLNRDGIFSSPAEVLEATRWTN
jgi:hypothetical protein